MKIDFESAKKSLRGLDALSTKGEVVTSKKEGQKVLRRAVVENIVHQTLMSQKRDKKFSSTGIGPSSTKKHKNKNMGIAERKATSSCKKCEKRGHWARDYGREQPKNSMMSGSSSTNALVKQTRENEEDSFFTKRNVEIPRPSISKGFRIWK